MKKIGLSIVTVFTLLIGFTALAQNVIIIKQKPAMITKEGDTYMIPAGTDPNTSYYYYTQSDTRYVCTYTEPTELVGTNFLPLSVNVGGSARNVRCYPDTYFTIQAAP